MKVLVTGFEPFNGSDKNPSQLIVEKLEAPAGVELVKQILPVEFDKTNEILTKIVDEVNPDLILSFGQNGYFPHISIERLAVNIDNTKSPDGRRIGKDATGKAPVDEKIFSDGPDAYFATVPVWEMVDAVKAQGLPARVSYSAGTFVCNHVMYLDAVLAEKHEINFGFVHVPFLPEQLIDIEDYNGKYSMSFDDMMKAANAIMQVVCK